MTYTITRTSNGFIGSDPVTWVSLTNGKNEYSATVRNGSVTEALVWRDTTRVYGHPSTRDLNLTGPTGRAVAAAALAAA